jgi:hypothetical protein
VHVYENDPVLLNVREAVPVVMLPTFEGAPAVENVTLCATVPASFVHVTVPPFVIVTLPGENENTAVP